MGNRRPRSKSNKYYEREADSSTFSANDYLNQLSTVIAGFLDNLCNQPDYSLPLEECQVVLKRVTDELNKQEISAIRDQKGSKLMERIFLLQLYYVRIQMENIKSDQSNNALEKINEDSKESSKEEKLYRLDPDCEFEPETEPGVEYSVQNVIEFVIKILLCITQDVLNNCRNMYASFSIQKLLNMIPILMSNEQQGNEMSLEDAFLWFINSIRQTGQISQLMVDPAASHVIRSCLILLNGFYLESFSKQAKDYESIDNMTFDNNLKEKFQSTFDSNYATIFQLFQQDIFAYVLTAPGCFLINLLLQIFEKSDQSVRYKELQQLLLPSNKNRLMDAIESLERTFKTSNGSRLYEQLIELASADTIHLIVFEIFKDVDKFNEIAIDKNGNFIVQHLLVAKNFGEPHLTHILHLLDIKKIVENNYTGILWKLSEACIRTQSNMKLFSTSLLSCFNSSNNFKTLWWSIITLNPFTLQELNEFLADACNELQDLAQENSQEDKKPNKCQWLKRLKDSGISILSNCVRFQEDAAKPFVQGFKAFVTNENLPILLEMMRHRQASWLFQAIFNSKSSLPKPRVNEFLKSIVPHLPKLVFDSHAAFVVTAAYNYATGDLKGKIIETMKPEADKIKDYNVAVYKALDLQLIGKDEVKAKSTIKKKTDIQRGEYLQKEE